MTTDDLRPLPAPHELWAQRSDISRKPRLQVREAENDSAITDYERIYRETEQRALAEGHPPLLARKIAGAALPPLDVVETADGDWLLADGFQRDGAIERLGWDAVPIRITRGTHLTALGIAFRNNAKHGTRWTNADKRRAARLALEEEDLYRRSDVYLADFTGVSAALIKAVRAEIAAEKGVAAPTRTVTRNGTTYEMAVRRQPEPYADDDGLPARQVDEDDDPGDDPFAQGAALPPGFLAQGAAARPASPAPARPNSPALNAAIAAKRAAVVVITYTFADTGESDSLDVSQLGDAPAEVRRAILDALGMLR